MVSLTFSFILYVRFQQKFMQTITILCFTIYVVYAESAVQFFQNLFEILNKNRNKMESPITLLLQKDGKFYGKFIVSEKDLTCLKKVKNSQNECSASQDSKTETVTPSTNLFIRSSKQKSSTPILEAGTKIKQTMQNFIFRAGISPAQEIEIWKCFSIPKVPTVVSITREQNSLILIETSPTQTALEFLNSNKANLDLERIELYRLYTSDSIWVEDNMQLGEFGTEYVLEKAKNVIIQLPDGKFIMYYWDSELVTEFQQRVMKLSEVKCKVFLFCCGYSLRENQQMKNTNVGDFSTVVARPLLLGGGGTLSCDVDLSNASMIVGKGAKDGPTWLIYESGLNILCRCSNVDCASSSSNVVVPLGYPVLETILPEKFNYKCPACNNTTNFSIVTFVVSNARAKFTFLKCSSSEIETVMLESTTNDSEDYVLFLESDTKRTGYDYIEIATVKFGMSFNKCQHCNQTMQLSEEQIMPCGRAFHENCLNWRKTCAVCSLQEYKLTDLNKIVASTSSNESFTLHFSSHQFGNCSNKSTDKVVPKYIWSELINKFSKSGEKQSLGNSLELQQRFIIDNLPALIRDTIVNTIMICELRQRDIFSEEDEEILASIQKQTEKTRKMYRIIGTRVGGLLALIDVLKICCQSGAVETLSQYVDQLSG